MAILEVQGLVKYYGSRKVVDGVSFKVDIGEVVGLLGPNGAGKTTSFRMTTGQVTPNGGKVTFDGKDVTTQPMFKRARLGMGYLAQETSVFRKLSVEQNIHAILEAQPVHRGLGRKMTRPERIDACDKVLAQFSLSHLRGNNAARLSGGEKRRLEIARCLVCDPLLILLDEPFAGIDPKTIADIQEIVRGLRDQGIGVLVTDHQVRDILTITDRSYLIKKGNVVTHGTAQELVRDPIAIQEYLGNSFNDDPFGLFRSGTEAARGMQAQGAPRANSPLHEHMARLLDQLRTTEGAVAAGEIIALGYAAVPCLLEALERRELDMRRVCWELLKRVHPNPGEYDPLAPEVTRVEQVCSIRISLTRRAG